MKQRSLIPMTLAAVLLLWATPSPGFSDNTLEEVRSLSASLSKKAVTHRRHLHAHPEKSNREEKTAAYVAQALRVMGLDPQTGIAHHGVVAMIEGAHPGPVIGVRADMDALPILETTGLPFASQNEGVMHGCGHDIHTAILLGTAEALIALKDRMHGSVKLIFQPAEEGAPVGEEGGAELMEKEGVLLDPDVEAVFALHVFSDIDAGQIGYSLGGTFAAVDRFTIKIHGQQVHAAYPWNGIDPVVTAAQCVTALQTIASRRIDTREPVVVTVGVIEGGERWNIIPSEVTLKGTVRTHSEIIRQQAEKEMNLILDHVTQAYGASYEMTYERLADVTWNDPELGKKVLPFLSEILGPENVLEVKPTMGGEDFAFFAAKVPGFYFRLGVRSENTPGSDSPLHTPTFSPDESSIEVGIKSMTNLVLRYLDGQ